MPPVVRSTARSSSLAGGRARSRARSHRPSRGTAPPPGCPARAVSTRGAATPAPARGRPSWRGMCSLGTPPGRACPAVVGGERHHLGDTGGLALRLLFWWRWRHPHNGRRSRALIGKVSSGPRQPLGLEPQSIADCSPALDEEFDVACLDASDVAPVVQERSRGRVSIPSGASLWSGSPRLWASSILTG